MPTPPRCTSSRPASGAGDHGLSERSHSTSGFFSNDTILLAPSDYTLVPSLQAKPTYDPIKDFAPITQMVRIPNVLVMNADTAKRLKIATLKDFVAYARANPAKLNYGSGGNGSAGHLGGEILKARAGFFAVHIPYSGGAPSQLALLAGQVDYTLDNLATAAPNIRAGKINALAVTSAQRSPLLPDVPTIAEVLPGYQSSAWFGLFGPARMDPALVRRLSDAARQAIQSPEVRKRIEFEGATPVGNAPEDFAKPWAQGLPPMSLPAWRRRALPRYWKWP